MQKFIENIKFIQEALKNASVADVQVAQVTGDNALFKVMQTVVSELKSLENATSVFVRFDIHPKVLFLELAEGMEILENKVDEKVTTIFGTVCDKSLDEKYVKVSVLCFYK